MLCGVRVWNVSMSAPPTVEYVYIWGRAEGMNWPLFNKSSLSVFLVQNHEHIVVMAIYNLNTLSDEGNI